MIDWSNNSFFIIVMGLMGIAAIFSSIMTIRNGIKQLSQPIKDLENKVETYKKETDINHMKNEKRISELEDRMVMAEADRDELHKVNKLTLQALLALLNNNEKDIKDASKDITKYMIEESA